MLIKFAIASNKNFEEKTVPIVVESLIKSNIPAELIHVFSAGYSNYTYKQLDTGVHYHQLDHNSYEYSPLISIVEHELSSEYWFLIHDTCKVGPNFKKLVYSIPHHKPEKVALTVFPSMSIGSYRYDYLMSSEVKAKLLAIKNTDYSEDSMINWKAWGVKAEDYILHKTNPLAFYYSPEILLNRCVVIDNNNWYNTKTTRITEYWSPLDLYKNKSNWHPKQPKDYVRVV